MLPVLQTNNKTFLGRHWTEHNLLRRYMFSDKNISILSFGCSTGEELLSLRLLFPNANLCGCDIDWLNLQTARGLLGSGVNIFYSSREQIESHGPFDLILCNSVLLAPTKLKNGAKVGIDGILWEDILSMLIANINPGGFLQIVNSNIPFRFHPLADVFAPMRSSLVICPNFVDQFDLNGNHLCSGTSGSGWSAQIPHHTAEKHWELLTPSDLIDVHFFKKGAGVKEPNVINDELLPNLPQGRSWASGIATYSSSMEKKEGKTKTEIENRWSAVDADSIRIDRVIRRYWFDLTLTDTAISTIEMYGPTATAFIEAMTGRRSTKITIDSLCNTKPIYAPQFG